MVDASSVTETITLSGKPSTGQSSRYYSYSKTYTKTWKNWCARCKVAGKMADNPKGVPEHEVTCTACGADFDVCTGGEKMNSPKGYLVDVNGKFNSISRVDTTIGDATSGDGSGDGSEAQTQTISHGYDVENPFKAYLHIEYSHEAGATAPRKEINLDFTSEAPDNTPSFSGIVPALLNYSQRSNSINVWELIAEIEGDKERKNKYYLRQIAFRYRTPDGEDLYPSDGTDDSTGKIIIDRIGFRKGEVINPTSLGFSGKTVLSNLQTCINSTNYLTNMIYGDERYEDRLEFYSPNSITKTNPKKTFSEGLVNEDYLKIIGLSDLTYAPVSTLVNNSIKIFSEKDNPNDDDHVKYNFVQSRLRESIMRYGNKEDVEVLEDNVSPTEAYYRAVTNDKFVNDMDMTYTIQVNGVPNITVGDYAKCVFYNQNLSDVKRVKSVQIDYNSTAMPELKTSLGMGAIEKILSGRVKMQEERRKAKENKIIISDGVTYTSNSPNLWEN